MLVEQSLNIFLSLPVRKLVKITGRRSVEVNLLVSFICLPDDFLQYFPGLAPCQVKENG